MSAAFIDTSTVAAPPAANLKPKEHGAYAILGIPVVSSLLVTGPTIVGLCLAIASVAGFMAHEPLLVAIGHRGGRTQRGTPAARKRLAALLMITVACGVIALVIGSAEVRWALFVCGSLAIISFAVAMAGKHKTLGGQLLGVMGLSAPSVPILLAGEASATVALQVWGAWIIGFAATTMAVRSVIAAQKRSSRVLPWLSLAVLSLAVSVLGSVGYWLPFATLPMLAMSLYLMLEPPPAKQLRRVGWTLVAGTTASALWMVWVL